ncbi:HET-domain-containing protein, partial [Polyplosphaeria fusca]
MRECLTNHSQCSRPSSGWLPTRVIDVGSRDGSVDPRLIITADVQFECTQEEQRYVSLSHCWGKEHIITTTMANIEDRKSVIRLNELPQTFQDAILITRSLGERFLWIDSLCIIQDAIEDWRSESVQMCTIYQRAVVTIMAAHANGGGQGCFVSRDGLAQTPFRMKFKNADQEIMATACFLPLSRMSADVSYPRPLFSRAWVLQEQAISRARLIYFGEQVYWECQSARGSERNPDGGTILSGLTNFTKATVAADDPFAGEEPKDAQEFMENMHQQWCVLVENYMQRGITKTSDRLIAVDGLAQ